MTHQIFEDAAKVKYPYADASHFSLRDYSQNNTRDVDLQREAYIAGLEKCLPLVEALEEGIKFGKRVFLSDVQNTGLGIDAMEFGQKAKQALAAFPINESKPVK